MRYTKTDIKKFVLENILHHSLKNQTTGSQSMKFQNLWNTLAHTHTRKWVCSMNFTALICDGDLNTRLRKTLTAFTIADMMYLHNLHIKRQRVECDRIKKLVGIAPNFITSEELHNLF